MAGSGQRTNPLARESAARGAEQVARIGANQLIDEAMTGRASRPEDWGFQHSNLRTGAFDERQADQRSSPPHDRGHDGPELQRQDPARLYPAHRDLCQISRPLARYRDRRRHPPLPACAGRAGRAAPEDERAGLGVALLLHHHARPRRPRPSAGPHALSAQAAAGARCRSRSPGCSRRRPALVSSTRPRSASPTAPVCAAARSSCCGSATSIPSAC